MRNFLFIIALMLFGVAGPAWSQAAPATPSTSPVAAPGSTADLEKLVGTLQNDQQRTALIRQLQALIAAQKQGAPATAAPPAVVVPTLAVPNLIEGLTTRFQGVGGELADIIGIARAAPSLVRWIDRQVASAELRMIWLEAFVRLLIIFGAGTAAALIVGRLLRGARARFALRQGGSFTKWLVLLAVTLVLYLLPIAVFGAVATLVLATLHPAVPARPMAAVAIATILHAQAILVLARVLLITPAAPYFLRLSEESRTYLYIWIRRFTVWVVYGFGVAELARALRAPHSVADLIARFAIIVVAGLAIVFILQNRAAVSAFLRGSAAQPDRPRPATSTLRMIRNALADTWHIVAIVYILGSFGAYLVDINGGVGFVLRATLISILVLVGAGLAMRLIRHLDERGFAVGADLRARYPGLEARTNKYVPALIFVISAVVYAAAIVLLLEIWGIDALDWFARQYVRDIAGTLLSIVIVIAIAIAAWEVISAAVERALGGGDAERHAQVSARMRTLLPLIRSTVLIAIVTMAAFVVLAQIGVNIAPLLAGAGIIGIAVGLGSQALVKDIINGLFILVENTVTVGDYVDVGGGHAGTVQEISIRTMRLRDGAGALHTIPFSAVTTIANTNRGIGNAAVGVNVAIAEDSDRVSRALADIAREMRHDDAFRPLMLSELQLWGVDKIDGTTMTIVGQIVCTASGRWPVQREFNRRVKLRFEQEGIAFALPAQTIIVANPEPMPAARPSNGRPSNDRHIAAALRAPRDRG
ncbi:MAG TPA: mechanosensitive ion channel domain-containing protein [Stellaceae bacterium]